MKKNIPENEQLNPDDHWIISSDSVWKLRIYPKVGTLAFPWNNRKKPMRFLCMEVQLIDTSKDVNDLLPRINQLSRGWSTPEHYRAILLRNNDYLVYSDLEIEHEYQSQSIQFAFNISTFSNVKDSVEIFLGYYDKSNFNFYPKSVVTSKHFEWNKLDEPWEIDFLINEINQLIMPFDTTSYDKNAPLANQDWFKENNLKKFLPKKENRYRLLDRNSKVLI